MPYVIVRSAMSLDGYIDDAAGKRLILSNAEELALADEARASCDAILVGAGTIRADDPRLLIRSGELIQRRLDAGLPAQPIKATMTATGSLRPEARFFQEGDGPKLVFCPQPLEATVTRALHGFCTVIAGGDRDVNPESMLAHLDRLGVQRLLIEGGTTVNTMFISRALVSEIQVAVAPFFVGAGKSFVAPARFPYDQHRRMELQDVNVAGDMVVLRYTTTR